MWSIIMTLEILPVVLDELVLTVVVDNATDSLSSVDSGIPQLPEVVSLLGRIPATRDHEGHDAIVVFDQLCVACHGLSVLVQGRRGGEAHTMLFDVGPYGDVWIDNAKRLDIDLASIETIVLSHWHWDHSGGLPTVIAAIAAARRRAGKPDPVAVDLHPDRPDQRGIAMASGAIVMFPEEPTPTEMNDAGGRVELHDAPHLVNNGYFAVSGSINRVTSYETGLESHVTFRGDRGRPDPLILDERFVAAQVRGRGVSVLSACSHAGIVNVCLAAQCQFPGVPIDVVVGGYHLAGAAMERRIAVTVDDLDRLISPRVVAPAHCTGWRARARTGRAILPRTIRPERGRQPLHTHSLAARDRLAPDLYQVSETAKVLPAHARHRPATARTELPIGAENARRTPPITTTVALFGSVAQSGSRAALSRRRPRVQIPSGPPRSRDAITAVRGGPFALCER